MTLILMKQQNMSMIPKDFIVTNSLEAVTFDTHSHEATEEVANSLCCR